VTRAAHALVSRAGLAFLMRVRSACRRALGTARAYSAARRVASIVAVSSGCARRNVARAVHALVSCAGLAYLMRVRSTCRCAFGTARDYTAARLEARTVTGCAQR
jgi:hypothetical protein